MRESDILYKIKNRNIFFLIEHQSKIDYSMNYRILEYSKEIIDKVLNREKVKNKNYKIPVIYSTVLYTGRKRWDVEKVIEDKQEFLPGIKKRRISEYEVVDINDYSEEELIKKEGILSKIMLMEKSKTKDDLVKKIKTLVKANYKQEEKDVLERIIYYIFSSKLTKEELKEIVEKLEEKKEEKDMVAEEILKKSWDEEYKRGKLDGKALGRKEGEKNGIELGKIQLIIEMIKNDADEDFIIKVSGITKKKMKEIKEKYIKNK